MVARDPRVQQLFYRAGFYGLYNIGNVRYDRALITILVERWRPETHTFHMPPGKRTVTLQDIAILTGLRIDGDPIIGRDDSKGKEVWK